MILNPENAQELIRQLLEIDPSAGGARPPGPPLPPERSGGNYDPMEARVAKLEAHMEHVRSELAKLAALPADVATIKERLAHLPTKVEAKADIDSAVEKAAAKTQRTVQIVGGLVAIAVAAINYLPKVLGH